MVLVDKSSSMSSPNSERFWRSAEYNQSFFLSFTKTLSHVFLVLPGRFCATAISFAYFNCSALLLFCFCDVMKSLTKEKRYDLIDAFNSTTRYLDDLLNIDNIHFKHMVHRIYPAELQLNKANASDSEAAFLDLNLSIHNYTVSTKIYDKRDDFNFNIVNFPFLDGDVPRRPSYGVHISQLIRFTRAS